MKAQKCATWLIALFLTPSAFVFAQHGGGHSASGGHAMGGGHFAYGGHTAAAPFQSPQSIGLSPPSIGIGSVGIGLGSAGIGLGPSGIGAFGYRSQRFGGNPGFANRYSAYGPWRRGSRYGRNGYGLGYPYFGIPYYLPFLDGPYSDDFDDSGGPPAPDNSQGAPPPDQSDLGAQLQQLNAQVNELQYRLQRPQMPPPSAAPESPEAATSPTPPSPPVTVVLNNGQTLQVQSYAVMGDNFWDFSSHPTRKIPLAKIDLAASERASEASGTEFPQINPGR